MWLPVAIGGGASPQLPVPVYSLVLQHVNHCCKVLTTPRVVSVPVFCWPSHFHGYCWDNQANREGLRMRLTLLTSHSVFSSIL